MVSSTIKVVTMTFRERLTQYILSKQYSESEAALLAGEAMVDKIDEPTDSYHGDIYVLLEMSLNVLLKSTPSAFQKRKEQLLTEFSAIRMRKDYDNKYVRSLWGVSTEVELQKILDVWKSEMWQSTP